MGIDLNKCKRGDKLFSRCGHIFTYVERYKSIYTYRHVVRYPDGMCGTRTDDGLLDAEGITDEDIVSIYDDIGIEWEDI